MENAKNKNNLTTVRKVEAYLVLQEKSRATVEKYVRDASAFAAYTGDAGIDTKKEMMPMLEERYITYIMFIMLQSKIQRSFAI